MSHKSEILRKNEKRTLALPVLVGYYLTSLQLAGYSAKTLIAARSNLGRFVRFLEHEGHSLKLSTVSVQDARRYVASLQGTVIKYDGHPLNRPIPGSTLSAYTVWSHVRSLRAFSNWLFREGYTKTRMLEILEVPKLPKKKIDVLSPEEIRKLLESINANTFIGARSHTIVLLMLDTGVRAGELVGLKLSDIDWERGLFKVLGKGSKERFVPFGAAAKQAMLRYLQVFRPQPARPDADRFFLAVDGCPLSTNAVTHLMHRLGKNSGIPRLHAHLLRHTCGVQYLVAGGDSRSLQIFFGHASIVTTERYAQLVDEQVLAQHRKYSPMDALEFKPRRFMRAGKRVSHQITTTSPTE